MGLRVVITGMGAVTPIGVGVDELCRALEGGRSGLGPLTRFPTNGFRTQNAFEIKRFRPPAGTRLLDPFIQFAMQAAEEARERARFDVKSADPSRVGLVVSSSKGGLQSLHTFRERLERCPNGLLAARLYANLAPHAANQWIARKWGLQGPAPCYVTACTTGTTSIIEGARMIQEGMADYVFAGASDASLVPFLVAGYERMKALSSDGMLPFDRRRRGFLLGEGAGVVFLESLESARSRRAKIWGEIAGFAYGSDGRHPVAFDPKEDALATTLKTLLRNAKISLAEIDYMNLHGTGTRDGDVYETEQIKRAFGRAAYRLSTSSTKSMMGHMLGASGAVEVIACCLAMDRSFVPPTVALEKEDPQCDLDYTPRKTQRKKIALTVSISMGFGGHIAAIALRRV